MNDYPFLRCCRRFEASVAANEVLERALDEYMVYAFAAMPKKNMGMMSTNQLFRKSPPHFSLTSLKPDIRAPGSTITVVCHCTVLSVNSFEFVSAQACYFSQTTTTVFCSGSQVNFA